MSCLCLKPICGCPLPFEAVWSDHTGTFSFLLLQTHHHSCLTLKGQHQRTLAARHILWRLCPSCPWRVLSLGLNTLPSSLSGLSPSLCLVSARLPPPCNPLGRWKAAPLCVRDTWNILWLGHPIRTCCALSTMTPQVQRQCLWSPSHSLKCGCALHMIPIQENIEWLISLNRGWIQSSWHV